MQTGKMKETFQTAGNDEIRIVATVQGEQFESQGNTLNVVVSTAITNNHGLYDIVMEAYLPLFIVD